VQQAPVGAGQAGDAAGRSAMFSVPVMPYSMDTPIRNSEDAARLMAM
jgi:hypothetical protein